MSHKIGEKRRIADSDFFTVVVREYLRLIPNVRQTIVAAYKVVYKSISSYYDFLQKILIKVSTAKVK